MTEPQDNPNPNPNPKPPDSPKPPKQKKVKVDPLVRARREKLQRWRDDLGIDPYGKRVDGLINLTQARKRLGYIRADQNIIAVRALKDVAALNLGDSEIAERDVEVMGVEIDGPRRRRLIDAENLRSLHGPVHRFGRAFFPNLETVDPVVDARLLNSDQEIVGHAFLDVVAYVGRRQRILPIFIAAQLDGTLCNSKERTWLPAGFRLEISHRRIGMAVPQHAEGEGEEAGIGFAVLDRKIINGDSETQLVIVPRLVSQHQ